LCRNHHGEIDGQAGTFTVERLKAIKADHERWVRDSLPGYDQQRQQDDETYAGPQKLVSYFGLNLRVRQSGLGAYNVKALRDQEIPVAQSWTKNRRSSLLNRTRPRTLRCSKSAVV